MYYDYLIKLGVPSSGFALLYINAAMTLYAPGAKMEDLYTQLAEMFNVKVTQVRGTMRWTIVKRLGFAKGVKEFIAYHRAVCDGVVSNAEA